MLRKILEVTMPVSRRQFLQSGALAVVGCAASPLFAGGGHKNNSTAGTNQTTSPNPAPGRSAFEGVVGSSFQVSGHGQSMWLKLISVNDLPKLSPVNNASMSVPPPKTTGPSTKTAGFILSFNGGTLEGLPQGTYTFTNSSLGEFSLFIVPGANQTYTALFNHLQ